MRERTKTAFWVIILITASPFQVQETIPQVVAKAKPAVVLISTYDREGKAVGQGTGFFINAQGEIVTNLHLLITANSATVQTSSGEVLPVQGIVAEDADGDLVKIVVRGRGKAFPFLTLSPDAPKQGERVLIVGNPLGLEGSVSEGLVSAVREIPAFGKVFQTTAAISPGSSGSPVLEMKGQVVGVATFYLSGGQSLNFAIPSQRIAQMHSQNLKTLEAWLSAGPSVELQNSARRLYLIGVTKLFGEGCASALDYFLQAGKLTPDEWSIQLAIGMCSANLGRYQEGLVASKKAVRLRPGSAEAHYVAALASTYLGRYLEGLEESKQAIRIKPHFAEAHHEVARAAYLLDRYQEAVEASKEAIRLKPDFAEAHASLGVAYGSLERYDEAVEPLNQAIRLKPEDALTYVMLGITYKKLGRYQEALETLKQAVRLKPDLAMAHFELAGAYGLLRRTSEEVEACKEAIRLKPDYAQAHFLLGVIYLADFRNRGAALEQYRILKDLDRELAEKLFKVIYP